MQQFAAAWTHINGSGEGGGGVAGRNLLRAAANWAAFDCFVVATACASHIVAAFYTVAAADVAAPLASG